MISEIALEAIDLNPYDSRLRYQSGDIDRISHSMALSGQMCPIRVRPHPEKSGRYQLVYGQRRFLAAAKLGWRSIKAEIVDATNEQMIEQSVIENFERENLSDYEMALIFERMNREFNKTYEEIGRLLGISKQHVSNMVAMLRLFDSKTLSDNVDLIEVLQRISEHHARILLRIEDQDTRIKLARMVVEKNLSVKELSRIIARLRSWFPVEEKTESCFDSDAKHRIARVKDVEKIEKVIASLFQLPHDGDYDTFKEVHLFGEGFSLYSAFPPYERFEDARAVLKERHWFYEIAPKLSWKINDLKVTFEGHIALATLIVSYSGTLSGEPFKMDARGTVVLINKDSQWKILHEHWSPLGEKNSKVSYLVTVPFT
jgi:ParB family chromosome partitioning protein